MLFHLSGPVFGHDKYNMWSHMQKFTSGWNMLVPGTPPLPRKYNADICCEIVLAYAAVIKFCYVNCFEIVYFRATAQLQK